MSPKITFLHTSPAHIPTFSALLARIAPDAVATHWVDEALLRDARAQGHEAPEIICRVQAKVHAAAAAGADVVVCTCSTIGAAAEQTPTHGAFRAMRIDRAMANAAVRLGPQVLVVAALESTLAPTVALVRDSARALGREVKVSACFIGDAWPHFEAGHLDAYYAAIAGAVRAQCAGVHCVVLAQASMAPAVAALGELGVPILSSPEMGVRDALSGAAAAAAHSGATQIHASPRCGSGPTPGPRGDEARIELVRALLSKHRSA